MFRAPTFLIPALMAAGILIAEAGETGTSQRVTTDNFNRAETDMYFTRFAKQGGFGTLSHERELASIDNQTVIRLNRDTLYSFGVFDLDASPLTVTLPDPGKRYMAVQVINQDHYTIGVHYAPGTIVLKRDDVGTRYVVLAIRTFVDPSDAADLKAVHALQDAISTKQESKGEFTVPAWDETSLTANRNALLALGAANGGLDSARMFGSKDQVDPVQFLIGTAAGWGGNLASAALYVGVNPPKNDGKTPYIITMKDVPVDGFWSISVYNKDGFFEKNAQGAYTINNVTAKAEADGSVKVRFGGDEKALNHLPITPGWNYLIRLYRPRPEISNGTWKAPEAKPVE